MPSATAKAHVRLGRGLRHMAVVEKAWLAGDISAAQVSLLESARELNDTAFAKDEADLVDNATRLHYSGFARTMGYWRRFADADKAEDDAGAQWDARRLHLSRTFGGTWRLDGQFDPISGAIVAAEVERLEHELFKADWAEAEQIHGDAMCSAMLARTHAQLRADALVEMAKRSAAVHAGSRLPEPLFSVLVGYETFCRSPM